jgi:hypothetical protein
LAAYTLQPNFTNMAAAAQVAQQPMMMFPGAAAAVNTAGPFANAAMMDSASQYTAGMPMYTASALPVDPAASAMYARPSVLPMTQNGIVAGPPSELYMNGKVYKIDQVGAPAQVGGAKGGSVATAAAAATSVVAGAASTPQSRNKTDKEINDMIQKRVEDKVAQVLAKSKSMIGSSVKASSSYDNHNYMSSAAGNSKSFAAELKALNKKMKNNNRA